MQNQYTTFLFVLAFAFLSCDASEQGRTYAFDAASEKSGHFDFSGEKEEELDDKQVERKLIKKGFIEYQTDDLDEARKNVLEALEQFDGYLASDQSYTSSSRISLTLSVRVPAKHFDDFLSAATDGVERFDQKNINVEDVTEQFLDIQARLTTKKELEKRYLSLLQKANTVTEILEIEKNLGELRSDIESFEGRLKYLENQVALSTLNITIYETIPTPVNFAKQFKNGFRNGWDNLIWFFVGIVNIWPFVVLGILLVIGFRRWRRRRKAA